MSPIVLVIFILVCVALILLASQVQRPIGYIAIAFGALALLLAILDFAKIFH